MEVLIERRTAYPTFMSIVDAVSRKNPFQAKRIRAYIEKQDSIYWDFAENLSQILNHAIGDSGARQDKIAQAYSDLCMEMVREQIKFSKTGVYPVADEESAREQVYDDPEKMHHYMMGLLVTQMLWPNHYLLFRFFQDSLKGSVPSRCLEIGAGHGLFTTEVLRRFPLLTIDVCDISATSINVSKQILSAFGVDAQRVVFVHKNFFEYAEDAMFDLIVMGEVLEHVEDPVGFLKKAKSFLSSDGRVYMSTCANCPAIDHVCHFRTIQEIRDVIHMADLFIQNEIVLPAEAVPAEKWEETGITINYGSILKHSEES